MRAETILIVDDEKLIRWSLRQELTKAGFTVLEAENVQGGYHSFTENEPDLMILDQLMPDGTGIDLLKKIKSGSNMLPVIMLTAIDRSDVAVQAMKLGAIDYVTKPVNIEELKIVIDKALESTRLKRQVAHLIKSQQKESGFCGMIGSSPVMKKVFEDISKIAQSRGTTVLITGESGTGKELAARAIHLLGERREKPLMTVNFSALSESLIETELFGHEKGSFTGATSQKKGIFEIADGGAILLDEIGDISPKMQVRLLRVLEQKAFQRVGGTAEITVDIRIIAATNQSLEKLVGEDKFRSDLYYRLNVAYIQMPALRERGEDIILLANNYLQEFNTKFHKAFKGFTQESRDLFLRYHWPGNVRELRNVLERAVLLNEDEFVSLRNIELLSSPASAPGMYLPQGDAGSGGLSLYDMEKQVLTQALVKTDFNQSKAAKLLKISRDTLRYRMKKYGLLLS